MKLNCKNTKSGFTLMELMVVIAIIGIIAAISIPNLISSLPKSRLRGATRDLVSCFQEMKLRAISQNARTVVVFNLATNQYRAFVDNNPQNGQWDAAESIIQDVTLPADVILYFNNFVTAGFTNRGLAITAGNVRIRVGNTDFRSVIISTMGNIRVQSSSDGIAWN